MKGRLRVEVSLGTVRLAGWPGCAVVYLPSQGEPPSSMAVMLQGFVVVSGVGRAIVASLLRLASANHCAWLGWLVPSAPA